MGRKIMMVVIQPFHDETGQAVLQPGMRLEEDDKRLKGLPPGVVRPEVVEEPDEPKPSPTPKAAEKPSTVGAKASDKK